MDVIDASLESSRRSEVVRLPALDADLDNVAGGGAAFKAVRGEYGAGKTFVTRYVAERALRRVRAWLTQFSQAA